MFRHVEFPRIIANQRCCHAISFSDPFLLFELSRAFIETSIEMCYMALQTFRVTTTQQPLIPIRESF